MTKLFCQNDCVIFFDKFLVCTVNTFISSCQISEGWGVRNVTFIDSFVSNRLTNATRTTFNTTYDVSQCMTGTSERCCNHHCHLLLHNCCHHSILSWTNISKKVHHWTLAGRRWMTILISSHRHSCVGVKIIMKRANLNFLLHVFWNFPSIYGWKL